MDVGLDQLSGHGNIDCLWLMDEYQPQILTANVCIWVESVYMKYIISAGELIFQLVDGHEDAALVRYL